MSSADQTPAASNELRADIRRLGDLLGETLVRQEGPELLELVERVRALTRSDGEAAERHHRAPDQQPPAAGRHTPRPRAPRTTSPCGFP
ncbi:phosphoenolpyruvate carboxylase, partial [Streptomyces hundungensis]|uniref:phosphoenolpyruvate carboxylase n=1 Tax=Streptomyces hundungensis TaxID=1077946 RepID=UPI003407AF0C